MRKNIFIVLDYYYMLKIVGDNVKLKIIDRIVGIFLQLLL